MTRTSSIFVINIINFIPEASGISSIDRRTIEAQIFAMSENNSLVGEEEYFDEEQQEYEVGEEQQEDEEDQEDQQPVDACAVRFPVWKDLSFGEIYDVLNPTKEGEAKEKLWSAHAVNIRGKALAPRTVLNAVLKKQKALGKIPQIAENDKTQTNIGARSTQRESFACQSLSDEQLEDFHAFLRTQIKPCLNQEGAATPAIDIPVNVGARIVMLAVEADSLNDISAIFASPAKGDRRAVLDDKSLRTGPQWEGIASNYINASNWAPENPFDDRLIEHIDPRSPPPVEMSGLEVTKLAVMCAF